MSFPMVSIIINNYNYGHYLGEAIDSALAQTYSHVEVIVVDDGSTDDSRQVIESYGERVTPVFKTNGGQGSAYNAGFSVARGQYIHFLDSDDTLFPHAVSRIAAAANETRIVKVQWPLATTNASGKPTGELSTKRSPPEGDISEMVRREGPYYDFDITTGSAYSQQFLERVLPVPESGYRNGADVYFITLAPIFGPIKNIDEPLGTYRGHGSNNYRGRALDEARIRNYRQRFETNSEVLAKFLRMTGRDANPEQWKRLNFNYLWPDRLLQARADLMDLVPEGSAFVLVDGNEWGENEPLPERRSIPFLERDGIYWGPPPNDEAAVRELERASAAGVEFVVIWWTAFWWIEEFGGWARHLRDRYRCILRGDHLIVYDLRSGNKG